MAATHDQDRDGRAGRHRLDARNARDGRRDQEGDRRSRRDQVSTRAASWATTRRCCARSRSASCKAARSPAARRRSSPGRADLQHAVPVPQPGRSRQGARQARSAGQGQPFDKAGFELLGISGGGFAYLMSTQRHQDARGSQVRQGLGAAGRRDRRAHVQGRRRDADSAAVVGCLYEPADRPHRHGREHASRARSRSSGTRRSSMSSTCRSSTSSARCSSTRKRSMR